MRVHVCKEQMEIRRQHNFLTSVKERFQMTKTNIYYPLSYANEDHILDEQRLG